MNLKKIIEVTYLHSQKFSVKFYRFRSLGYFKHEMQRTSRHFCKFCIRRCSPINQNMRVRSPMTRHEGIKYKICYRNSDELNRLSEYQSRCIVSTIRWGRHPQNRFAVDCSQCEIKTITSSSASFRDTIRDVSSARSY